MSNRKIGVSSPPFIKSIIYTAAIALTGMVARDTIETHAIANEKDQIDSNTFLESKNVVTKLPVVKYFHINPNEEWLIHSDTLISNGLTPTEISDNEDKIDSFVISRLKAYPPEIFEIFNGLNPQIIITNRLMMFDTESANWLSIPGVSTGDHILIDLYLLQHTTTNHEMHHQLTRIDGSIFAKFLEIDTKYGIEATAFDSYLESATCNNYDFPLFYDCYGAMDVGEDSSTIAAGLLTGDPYLYELAKTQPSIAEKIQATIEYYKTMSKGRMDEFYFERIRNGEIIQFDYPY